MRILPTGRSKRPRPDADADGDAQLSSGPSGTDAPEDLGGADAVPDTPDGVPGDRDPESWKRERRATANLPDAEPAAPER